MAMNEIFYILREQHRQEVYDTLVDSIERSALSGVINLGFYIRHKTDTHPVTGEELDNE